MSIAVSTIPTVKAWLVSNISSSTTVAADGSILVCYDDPPAGAQSNDIISVGRVEQEFGVSAMVGSGGTGWLEEIYHQDVTVTSFDGGNDAQTAMERCCLLMAVVVNVVRTDPSCGGSVIIARPDTAAYELLWSEEGAGRFAVGTLRVRVHARI